MVQQIKKTTADRRNILYDRTVQLELSVLHYYFFSFSGGIGSASSGHTGPRPLRKISDKNFLVTQL
jgi:hypothetical protein